MGSQALDLVLFSSLAAFPLLIVRLFLIGMWDDCVFMLIWLLLFGFLFLFDLLFRETQSKNSSTGTSLFPNSAFQGLNNKSGVSQMKRLGYSPSSNNTRAP